MHTPPTEGIGISWGVGSSVRPKNLKKCMKLNWNFQRGGGILEKIPSMGRYGYFLELHNQATRSFSIPPEWDASPSQGYPQTLNLLFLIYTSG